MRKTELDKKSRRDKLFSMVRYANKNVPFYMELYRDCQNMIEEKRFSELPIINKEIYVSKEMSGLSMEYMGEYIRGELLWARTSGTSGVFSEVFWHPRENQRSLLPLWLLRKKYYGISGRNRLGYFYEGGAEDALAVQQGNSMALARSCVYDGRLEEGYRQILSYDPEWMILQPGIALLLCDCAGKFGVPPSLRYVEFTGEYLESSVRRRVEAVFQCKTANQYGTKEVNSIAYECPCGKLHIMKDNVYVETVSDEREPDISYLCITSLQNYGMPLIRYQLEDRGEIQRDVSCACGCRGDVLELKSGRANDMVVLRNHVTRHPYMLLELFQAINYQTEGAILQYQIEQKAVDRFVVRLVWEEEELKEEITEEIRHGFLDRLGYEVQIDFEYRSEAFPRMDAGKPAVFLASLAPEGRTE